MNKSRTVSEQQIGAAKLRALSRIVSEGTGVVDPRTESLMKLLHDLNSSKDERAIRLAEALGKFSVPELLMMVDRIAPKRRGGQKRPHISDGELVIEIIDRVAKGEVLERVARELAERADGNGTLASKAQRLKVEFRKIWKSNSEISPKT